MQNKKNIIINKLNQSTINLDLVSEIARAAKYSVLIGNSMPEVDNFLFRIFISLIRDPNNIKSFLNTAPFQVIDYQWFGLFLNDKFPDLKVTSIFQNYLNELVKSSVIQNYEWTLVEEFYLEYLSDKMKINTINNQSILKAKIRENLLGTHFTDLEETSKDELLNYLVLKLPNDPNWVIFLNELLNDAMQNENEDWYYSLIAIDQSKKASDLFKDKNLSISNELISWMVFGD